MLPLDITDKNPILNHLLAALPEREFKRMLPKMKEIPLVYDTDIYKLNDSISDVYFPNSGIISLLAAVDQSSTTEVGIVGREGMVGLPVFLGVNISRIRAVVQGPGRAIKMKATDLRAECAKGGELNGILLRFANSMMVQISQSAVCFRFHLIEQRLARWLLMTGDRMEKHDFKMTQEFLSNMLGVRREAVNRATKSLEKLGLIENSRGSVEIMDRQGLESVSCVCYSVVREEEERVIASSQAAGQ
jgi:CRP-like cAMP-binding protein